MDITKWCTRIIEWSFALLFILVPFILTSSNYELFEYNKMMITYALTVVIVLAWAIKMIHAKEVHIRRTPLDIPIALFVGSQLLATVFSMDPHVSWLGYYSRFNGGMFSVISYILLYYAFVSNWTNETNLTHLLKIMLASATIVALYAALEHFGYSVSCLLFTGKFDVACWVQDVQNRVFATLGQPNWLAAYLAALIPVSLVLAISKKLKQPGFWLWGVTSLLFFTVLLFTKSRSGLMGFAIADALLWALVFIRPRPGGALRNFAMLHVAFAVIIFFVGTNVEFLDKYITLESVRNRTTQTKTQAQSAVKTDTLLSSGGTESGVIRKYVWEGAITAWKSSVKTFLVGTGTETFAFAFYQNKPKAHNLTSEWDFLYNKAHNEYLNYLTTTGIFGLGSYLLFLGAFIVWYARITIYELRFTNKKDSESSIHNSSILILNSLFAGWFSILITNFFGFSVVIMQLFLFLFPAMIFASEEQPHKFLIRTLQLSQSVSRVLYLLVIVMSIFLLYVLTRFWIADTDYAKGYQYNRFGKILEAKNYLRAAIEGNPLEPVYRDEYSVILAQLAAGEIEAQNATTAALFAQQSLQESDKALSISPNNVNFWKSRTKIYYAIAAFDPTFAKAALEALQRALTLAPTDPKITYNIAVLYGKFGENQKAVSALQETIDLKPNYRDAYAALVIFYKTQGKEDLARGVLQQYLTKVDPNDKDFTEQLKQ
ncbi:O-antigen ligase family protein [Candidatus Gottesmanbacteria bacterium]|nr:O-antigen ligase family protein [Candidatus Gottesmanbacteria bacterium]